MKNDQFSLGELLVAMLGGAAVGGLLVAAAKQRATNPTVLPSGAAVVPMTSMFSAALPGPGRRLTEAAPGTPISPQLRAASQTWQRPARQAGYAFRRFATLDDLMRSCPTNAEMEQIRADFNVSFSPDIAVTSWSCTEGGAESSVILSVYNIFRVARALNFDAPMPVLGVTNVYDWLRSLNLNWYFVTATPENPYSHGGGNDAFIVAQNEYGGMADASYRQNPPGGVASSPLVSYLGSSGPPPMMDLPFVVPMLSVLLHEARHTVPGGSKDHPCAIPATGGNPAIPYGADPSLAWGGAWAVEYWFRLWCAEHSGNFLNSLQRQTSANDARNVTDVFCGEASVRPIVEATARPALRPTVGPSRVTNAAVSSRMR